MNKKISVERICVKIFLLLWFCCSASRVTDVQATEGENLEVEAEGEDTSDENDPEPIIKVSDIEINNFQQELNVGDVMRLNAKVLPENATSSVVSFSSSDPSIAVVNSSGEVTGIAKGQVIIYVSSGEVRKEVPISVTVATQRIILNKEYIVLRLGEIFQLHGGVYPQGAPEQLTYETLDSAVATVDENGQVRARGCGNTAIIVSNEDVRTQVSVIVNERTVNSVGRDGLEDKNTDAPNEISYPHIVQASEYSLINSEMLKYFYNTEQKLIIEGDGYTISLDGRDIVNTENELLTDIQLRKEKQGIVFEINAGNPVCGMITVDLKEKVTEGSTLYLYNSKTEQYQKLNYQELNCIEIDSAGKYLFSEKKMNDEIVPIEFIGLVGTVCVIGGVVYVKIKKPYVFW